MKIAVLDDYQRAAENLADWKRLKGCEVTFLHERITGDENLVALLGEFDAVVAMRERTELTRYVIEHLPRLRLIVTTGTVNRAIDMEAARVRGIIVSGTDWAEDATVELAWALMLGLAHNIKQEDASIREGGWQSTVGVSLKGNTLGVIGLGSIGSKVAIIGRAFGMRVVAFSPNLTQERADVHGVQCVDKNTLLETSDFISVHLRLSDQTRDMVCAPDLARMKKSAFIVNTSRGPLVNECDLAAALCAGQIAGAGVDVFNQEPIGPDHPLLKAPNTLLTPHIGYVTREVYATWYEAVLEDIEAYRRGTPIRLAN
ncbi:Phosphoglycerate dehydrogenase [Variovorax sp. YR266]|uniref:D-2-hydroxyacid dehydrogenase family protein n=1 Tax=Variovorax sp. YR266 TaxID=1884386 RepID=UPI00089D02AB|nr:D-2-hydroxyacid dehydrogenase family protein [Variovorax sp. YR266]SDY35154.1 Phosphoglycerate dehydrogenase [Variovorax sp. YR266]